MLSPLFVAAVFEIFALKGAADKSNVLIVENVVTPLETVGRNWKILTPVVDALVSATNLILVKTVLYSAGVL